MEKGVDKERKSWYYNKAVARKSEWKGNKNRMNSEFRGESGLECNRLTEKAEKKV